VEKRGYSPHYDRRKESESEENTSVKGQTSRELGLILKERKRRAGE
jgi:hypothetical protein